jgi:hypothetical protein
MRVTRLRARLDWHREQVAGSLADPQSGAIEALLEFVRSYDDEEAYAALERAGDVAAHRAFLSLRVLAFTAATERRKGAELLSAAPAGTPPIESTLHSNPWGAYAGMAATLDSVDLSGCRSFVVVGCGPLPDSLLCLHERTEIDELVGIDRDTAALRTAGELVRTIGLERVRLAWGDGLELDYGAFDAICPSVFAAPRRGLLERIAATARDDAVIILRDPFFTGTLLFEPAIDALPARLEVRFRTASLPGPFMLRRYVLGVRARQRSGSA